MNKKLKTNKALRVFTFVLICITVIGIPIVLLLKDEYSLLFKAWVKGAYKTVKGIYDNLPPAAKQTIRDYAIIGKDKAKMEVRTGLINAGVKKDDAEKLVKAGSGVVSYVVKDTERKLSK